MHNNEVFQRDSRTLQCMVALTFGALATD